MTETQDVPVNPLQDRPLPIRVKTYQRNGQQITGLEYDYDVVAPDGSRKTVPMHHEIGCLSSASATNVVNPLGLAVLTLLGMYEEAQRRVAELEERPRRGRPPTRTPDQGDSRVSRGPGAGPA